MTFKRLLNYLKPYKRSIFLVTIITSLSSIFTIFIPKLLGDFTSSLYLSVTNNTDLNTKYLYTLISFIGLFYLIGIISSLVENYIMSTICEKALTKLKEETNLKLSKLSISYYDTHKKGDIIARFNNDIESISTLFTQFIPRLISFSITLIGISIIMLTINVTISLIVFLSIPLTLIFSKLLIKLSKKKYEQYYSKNGYLNSLIEESYKCKETISLYNNDRNISASFSLLNKDLTKTNLKANLITNLVSPIASLINYAAYLLIIFLGAKYVFQKKLLLGDIQSLIQYTKQLSSPISSLSSLLASIQTSLIASQRVFALLDEDEEHKIGTKELKNIESIEFKNVSFSYNKNVTILNNFNLKISKGEKIAIIGETGSGKSTIINLLMRFYNINNGDIYINNTSIYEYDLSSYYNNISLIPQELSLFDDTINNNLLYGNNDKINLNNISFAKELLNKKEALLSSGEKQLITVARALIKDYDLLILDEATSDIDAKSEKIIQETINNISNDKIVIMVAHKLSTIINADKIIVIKNGSIIEIGTHQSLYKEKGEYYKYLQTL